MASTSQSPTTPSSEPQPGNHQANINSTAIVAGSIAGAVVFVCILVAVVVPLARRRRRARRESRDIERAFGGKKLHRKIVSGPDSLSPLLVTPLNWSPGHAQGFAGTLDRADADPEGRNHTPSDISPLMIPVSHLTGGVFLDNLEAMQSDATSSTRIPSRANTRASSRSTNSVYSQPSADTHMQQEIVGPSQTPSRTDHLYSALSPSDPDPSQVTPRPSRTNATPRARSPPPASRAAPSPLSSRQSRSHGGRTKTAKGPVHMAPLMEMETSTSSTIRPSKPGRPGDVAPPTQLRPSATASSRPTPPSGILQPLSVLTNAFRTSIHSVSTPSRSSVAASTVSSIGRYPSIAASSATYLTASGGDPEALASTSSLAMSNGTTRGVIDRADVDTYPSKQERERAMEKASRKTIMNSSAAPSARTAVPGADDRPRRAHLRDPDAVRVRTESRRQRGNDPLPAPRRGSIEIVRHNYGVGAPVR